MDIKTRGFTIQENWVNTIRLPSGIQVLNPGDRGYSNAWGGGPWNDWKMLDGSTATPWRMCSSDFLGAAATTRVIILPLGLTIASIVSLILVWQTTGMNPVMIALPSILLVVFAIFLYYSVFWTVAIVITLGALFAMGAGHKGGNAFLVALVIEFFALAVVTGGLGLGMFFYQNNAGTLFYDLGSNTPTAHQYDWATLASCSSYYDYFVVDNANIAFDADPALQFRNYCSEGWYTYIGLVADIVVTLQIILLTTTGVAYLRGGSSGAKSA